MITETSTNGSLEQRLNWLKNLVAALPQMQAAGVPVVGYTWWPLFDLIDWSYRSGLRPVEDFVARYGPTSRDTGQLAATLEGLGWQSLEHLPLEAYLAPIGTIHFANALRRHFQARVNRTGRGIYESHFKRRYVAWRSNSVGSIQPVARVSSDYSPGVNAGASTD